MSELDEIVRVLKGGGTILYPTDTVWGIGCDATNPRAVEKVFDVKNQAVGLPVIVLVDSIDMLHRFVPKVHPRIETLLFYHQRPLTVIYENCRHLASNVMGKNGSAAIRVTLDPFCRELIVSLGRPIVATEAALENFEYPSRFTAIDPGIVDKVDYVVRYKQDQTSEEYPSVIVRLSDKAELDFIRD
jgi:L-threonylcarbamoyladenylate synthase